jgi:PAS domain S-box-containing protein
MGDTAALWASSIGDPGAIVPLLGTAAAVCLYVAFNQLLLAQIHPRHPGKGTLALLAFLVAGSALAAMGLYKTITGGPHAVSLKWSLALVFPCPVLLVWFVALLSRVKSLRLLVPLTAAYVFALILHLKSPSGILFSDIQSLKLVNLPWGQAVLQPWATWDNPWRVAVDLPNAVSALYVLYACSRQYRRGEKGAAVKLALLSGAVFAANLHDMMILDGLHLAPAGLLAMVLATGRSLSRAVAGPPAERAPDARLPLPAAAAEAPEESVGASGRVWAPLAATALLLPVALLAKWRGQAALLEAVVLVAVLGLMLATIVVLYRVGSGKWVRRTAVLAVLFSVFAQLLAVEQPMSVFAYMPILGTGDPAGASARELFLTAGTLLLLTSFYLAGAEAGVARSNLERKHRHLMQEVAERRRVEQALKENEERFRALIENGNDIITVIGADGAIQYASASMERVLGYALDEVLGRSVLSFVHREETPVVKRALRQVLRARNAVTRVELRVRHADGSIRYLEGIGKNLLRDPVLRGIIVNARDVSERHHVEERLQHIRLEERERIRHDLHDSVGQDLTGLLCMAGSLSKRLRALNLDEASRAESIESGVRMAMKDVQAAIRGIAPVEPDPQGLVAALRDLVQRLPEDSRASVGFECPSPVAVEDNTVATQLFRIAQEALNNALRHARARKVTVSLARDADGVTLAVVDDGVGLVRAAGTNGGMGMRTMRARAESIGARLRIDGAAGTGTRVRCHWPAERAERNTER